MIAARLLALLGWCPHAARYVERRETKDGIEDVLHSVCEVCGHAKPLVNRTPEEHQQARQQGQIKPYKVTKATKDNVRQMRQAK